MCPVFARHPAKASAVTETTFQFARRLAVSPCIFKRLLCFHFRYSLSSEIYPNGATPLALLALLLFALPSELTLQKFVALSRFGERNHQLPAELRYDLSISNPVGV